MHDDKVFRRCIYLAVLAGGIVSWPALDKLLLHWTGFSSLVWLGNGLAIGPGKLRVFAAVLLAAAIASLALYFAASKRYRPGRIACLLAIFGLLHAQTFYAVYPSHNLDEIKIVNLPTIEYGRYFSRQAWLTGPIHTTADLQHAAKVAFTHNRRALAERWRITDAGRLEAYCYLNMASRLWVYGNRREPDRVGCVDANEENGFAARNPGSLQTLLASNIGCCSDYAYALKLLLDGAGIRNRRVEVNGHVFNEAWLEGRWNVLDATMSMAFHDSWENIQRRSGHVQDSVVVTIFPRHDLSRGDENPAYRSAIGHARQRWLLKAIDKELPVLAYR